MEIEKVSIEDLGSRKLNTSWVPQANHPAIPLEIRQAVSENMTAELLQGAARGAWRVGNEWNQIFPDLQLSKVEDFLSEIWRDKP